MIIRAQSDPKRRILIRASRHQYDSHSSDNRKRLCRSVEPSRKYDLHLRDRCKKIAREKHQDQSDEKHEPEYNIAEEIHDLPVSDTQIPFDRKPCKQVDHSEEQGVQQQLHRFIKWNEPQRRRRDRRA